ncbi:MAG: Protein mazG [Dehalococcoidia bacterium]|nr:Protein mazG [Dehalococcoidia bacterium]
MQEKRDPGSFETLTSIMSTLRQPDGCPWDREQTAASLKPYVIEEAYEVIEAVDSGDPEKLCEELGDLLLQVVFQAQIAAERQEFDIKDVIRGISDKLVHRHPHVFGNVRIKTAAEVTHRWEALKREEKGKETSVLDGVPRNMPALACSQALQERAARVGFDWPDVGGVMEKVVEETRELKEAAAPERRAEEFGDLLFALVNLARHLGIDAEDALRRTGQRFSARFGYLEGTCRERGVPIDSLSLEEMDGLWEEAKSKGVGDREGESRGGQT